MTGQSRHRPGGIAVLGRRAIAGLSAAMILLLSGTGSLQDANANGDTRTLEIIHDHTKESGSITFRRNGQYSSEGLRQLNWMLRDWRLDQQTTMDPRLFDIVWQVYREAGAREGIVVVSAYRAPETNAALRRRSRAVAEHSQHMRGKAMDFYLPGVSMTRVREIAMRLQHGGVGFYPHSRHQFVHLDAGGVRSWPRMPDGQLARLFPDGRTVHIPKSGTPMAGYEDAKAAILARGGTVAGFSTYAEGAGGPRKSLWATLFGGEDDEDSDFYSSRAGQTPPRSRVASAAPDAGGGFFASLFSSPAPAPAPPLPDPGAGGPGPAPAPAAVEASPVAIPMPPRRPVELAREAAKVASAEPIDLPSRPTPAEKRGEMRAATRPAAGSTIGQDDRAALRSLFEAAATPAGRGKSLGSGAPDAPDTKSFSGPAVVRPPSRR